MGDSGGGSPPSKVCRTPRAPEARAAAPLSKLQTLVFSVGLSLQQISLTGQAYLSEWEVAGEI